MKTISISEQAAQVCLDVLSDWLEDVYRLDAKTRKQIAALDELAGALDAEEWLHEKEQKREEEHQRIMKEWHAKQAAEEKATKKGKAGK